MSTEKNTHNGSGGVTSNLEEKNTSSSSSDSSTNSNSTSTGKSSPPTTPPEKEAVPVKSPLGPRSNHDASYSATPPRRSKKQTPPRNTARLGAIDEQSSVIAPDLPARNPDRKRVRYSNATKFFGFGIYSRSDPSVPPPDAYSNIVGPNGEKFEDVRRNRPFRPPNRGGWRRAICLGLVLFVVLLAIGLGVGLGVGLTRKKGTSSEDATQPTGSDSSSEDPFPIGTWAVPSYLTTTSDNCTSESSTWRCYPYTVYTSSNPTASFETLTWRISSPTNSTLDLRISNTNPAFSYPFTDVLLTLSNSNDARLSAFTFDYPYRKQVIPNADITGDGGATRCYYNDTILSVRLYSTDQGAGGLVDDGSRNMTATGVTQETWPYAIEFEEKIGTGPECYRYSNGQETDPVSVTAGSGDCICGYRNYGLA